MALHVVAAGSPEQAAADAEPAPPRTLVVELAVAPGRALGWIAFCLILGSLLIWKLATVAQWLGGVLVLIGVVTAVFTALAYIYPAGRIVIDASRVALPRGRSRPGVVTYPRADVGAAYLLRRSTPWLRSAPVLVVEAAGRAHLFPRDWFASETDQARVVDALAQAPTPADLAAQG